MTGEANRELFEDHDLLGTGRNVLESNMSRPGYDWAVHALGSRRLERGSWAKRDGPLAERQLHVLCFDAEDGGVDVDAHDEYNALHAVYAYKHYCGVDYSPAEGVRQVAEPLADRDDFELSDQAIAAVELDDS